jgi:hypothetical protein
MKAEHTPIPWRLVKFAPMNVTAESKVVANCACYSDNTADPEALHDELLANAEFIVRACNSHDRLVEALKGLVECSPCQNGCAADDMTCATRKAEAALAKAKGETE